MHSTSIIDESLRNTPSGRGTDPPRLGPGVVDCQPRRRRERLSGGDAHAVLALSQPSTLAPAAARQLDQLPTFAPLLEEVELAAWSSHRRRLSGNFHDWMLLSDGRVLVAAGNAGGPKPGSQTEAALAAQAVWASVRAHALHVRDAGTLLSLAARSLWPMPPATRHASIGIALVDPVGGRGSVATAGDCLVWRVRAATIEQLAACQPPLGSSNAFAYRSHDLGLTLRERLLIVADQPARRTKRCVPSIEAAFKRLNAPSHRRMTAADAVALVREQLEQESDHDPQTSASVVAVRRR